MHKNLIFLSIIASFRKNLCNFAGVNSKEWHKEILNNEALCLHLVCSKPRKLQNVTRGGVIVSTRIAWDCYPTSVTNGFPRARALRSGGIQPHASNNKKMPIGTGGLWMLYDNVYYYCCCGLNRICYFKVNEYDYEYF